MNFNNRKLIRRNVRRLLRLTTFIFISLGLTSCHETEKKEIWPPIPPIEWPLDVMSPGKKIEAEFQIIDTPHRLFSLSLNYLYHDQDSSKRALNLSGGVGSWLDESEKENIPIGSAERLYAGHFTTDKQLHPAPLKLKVSIKSFSSSEAKFILEKEIETHKIGLSSSRGNTFEKQLVVLPLGIGRYKLNVEVLSTSLQFDRTNITFKLAHPIGGK